VVMKSSVFWDITPTLSGLKRKPRKKPAWSKSDCYPIKWK
jgi:hypothetical protein